VWLSNRLSQFRFLIGKEREHKERVIGGTDMPKHRIRVLESSVSRKPQNRNEEYCRKYCRPGLLCRST
jgi:hypothetical protein